MRVLAFDMATRTGWCVSREMQPFESGVITYMNGKRTLPLEERLCKWRYDLTHMIDIYMPDLIAYEIAHHRGGPATRSGIGMETVLIMEAFMRGVPVLGIHSLSLKKFATGSGKAEKPQMINAANLIAREGKRRIVDDNEADAVCLASCALSKAEFDSYGRLVLDKPEAKRKKHTTKGK